VTFAAGFAMTGTLTAAQSLDPVFCSRARL